MGVLLRATWSRRAQALDGGGSRGQIETRICSLMFVCHCFPYSFAIAFHNFICDSSAIEYHLDDPASTLKCKWETGYQFASLESRFRPTSKCFQSPTLWFSPFQRLRVASSLMQEVRSFQVKHQRI